MTEPIIALKQAIPYIRMYKGKTFVVKAGGKVISRRETLNVLVEEVSLLHQLGIRVVLVHGGGPQATELSQRLGIEPVLFDKLLVAAIRELRVAQGKPQEATIHSVDLEGRGGKAWPNLLKLVEAAAASVADQLFPPKETLLLVQPGLIARYRLDAFLTRLVQASKSPDAASILLLVPGPDTGGIPLINGELTVPGLHPSQALWVSPEWLANRHNAAA